MRSVGSARVLVVAGTAWVAMRAAALLLLGLVGASLLGFLALLRLDDVDAHVGQHRHRVLDLLGGHLLGGQHRVQLVIGDVAARLGGLQKLLDRLVGEVEQRAVALLRLRRLRRPAPRSWRRGAALRGSDRLEAFDFTAMAFKGSYPAL